jgi:hypothetical protein
VLIPIPDLGPGVVGIEARDEVTAADYRDVLVPAVEAARAASPDGKVRMLYVLGAEFPEFSAGAAWQDAKLGLGQLGAWERIALVTDAHWLRSSIHALGWMMPGEVRVFSTGELDAARAWVTA